MRVLRILCLVFITSCASPFEKSDEPLISRGPALTRLSAFEISYVRGNNLHRFIATSGTDSATVDSYRDLSLTKKSRIELREYERLSHQAVIAITKLDPTNRINQPCRAPFKIELRGEGEVRKVEGCRTDESATEVSRLIRDTEFLSAK